MTTSKFASVILICVFLPFIRTLHLNVTQIIDSFNGDDNTDFIGFASNSGYEAESYDVTTEDGYILKIYHIPGDKSRPVLLMHGLIDTSDTYILRENTSLAVALANENHDVWAGNYRGNRYSRRHLTLNPDVDKKFWDYSFDEIASYDLTATIDFILEKTGQKQLSAIGHSEGTTIFYALGALKPEYNDKISVMVSLAPVCFIKHAIGLLPSGIPVEPLINLVLTALNQEELLAHNGGLSLFYQAVCTHGGILYDICNKFIFAIQNGYDPEQVGPEVFARIVKHFPAGTSRKNVVHLGQVGRRNKFARYDYGLRNFEVYNSISPPEYDLSKVAMKIALIVGKNDFLSSIADVKRLRKALPNVIDFHILEPALFNHIDYIWSRDAHINLYPYVISLLETYA